MDEALREPGLRFALDHPRAMAEALRLNLQRALARAPVWVWLVVIGNPRYRLALDPCLVLAAAVGLATLVARRAGEPTPSARLSNR